MTRAPLLLATTGGVATAAAAPPLDVLPGALVGLALLAAAVRRSTNWRSALAAGTAWASVAGLVGLRFLLVVVDRYTGSAAVAVLAYVAAVAVQALVWGLGSAAARGMHQRLGVPFPLAFGGGALLALSAPVVLPWSPALLLAPWTELVQFADVIGERGICVLLAIAVAGTGRHGLVAAAGALAVLHVAGALRITAVAGEDRSVLRVGVVDASVSVAERDDPGRRGAIVGRLRALSARADRAGAQLVVWPENAFPVPLDRASGRLDGSLSPVAGGAAAPRLIGLETYERRGGVPLLFNSATVVDADGRRQASVDKRVRLPFGEYRPWPGVRSDDIQAGGPAHVLRAAGVRVGVLNCYEVTSPSAGRDVARAGRPQLLVNLTNEAWFRGTTASRYLPRFSVLRAVELRTDVVRAANAGGGGWVDAAGRVRREGSDGGAAAAVVEAGVRPPGAAPTVYARLGDWPLRLALVLLLLVSSARRRPWAGRRARRGPLPSA